MPRRWIPRMVFCLALTAVPDSQAQPSRGLASPPPAWLPKAMLVHPWKGKLLAVSCSTENPEVTQRNFDFASCQSVAPWTGTVSVLTTAGSVETRATAVMCRDSNTDCDVGIVLTPVAASKRMLRSARPLRLGKSEWEFSKPAIGVAVPKRQPGVLRRASTTKAALSDRLIADINQAIRALDSNTPPLKISPAHVRIVRGRKNGSRAVVVQVDKFEFTGIWHLKSDGKLGALMGSTLIQREPDTPILLAPRYVLDFGGDSAEEWIIVNEDRSTADSLFIRLVAPGGPSIRLHAEGTF